MNKLDYYKILGLNKDADEKEIKKAYKKLAMKYHPDKNQGDSHAESKFKEIKEAYEVLINSEKRSAYDKYGHSAFNFNQNSSDFSNNNFSSGFGDIFSDIFNDFFNKNDNKDFDKSDLNLYVSLEINFEESCKECSKNININITDKCEICLGNGIKPGSSLITCPSCGGHGKIQSKQGFFIIQQVCNTCNGNKKIIRDPCRNCNGNGLIKKYKKLLIKIPSGIDNGDTIKISNEGNLSKYKNFKGDLYIKIIVKPHVLFTRNKLDLHCNVPINFSIAALGGDVEIPTLNGKLKLKIPEETQSGKLLKIKGKGIYSSRRKIYGDLICKIIIETPVNLDKEQKDLLKKLGETLNNSKKNNNSPIFENFLEKIKNFFDKL